MYNESTRRNNSWQSLMLLMLTVLLVACGPSRPPLQSAGHLNRENETLEKIPEDSIPAPVRQAPLLPPPAERPKLETYTVVVNDAPIKELLFALARDAKLNLDIYDNIEGQITINAIEQTLPQILDRIANQAAIRYQIDNDHLIVAADTPYLKTYAVDYVNMAREGSGEIELSTQIASTGTADVATGSATRGGGNNSKLTVKNSNDNKFWETLFLNIVAIVQETGKSSATKGLVSENVMIHREAGLLSVRANSKQHREVQQYIDTVIASAQRQVLIEATVVEVTLNNNYQSGVNWQRISERLLGVNPLVGTDGFLTDSGSRVAQQMTGSNLADPPVFTLNYTNRDNNLSATVRMLEEFGDVQVLSSPKIMALNNQTAVLKVVDNRVYFTVDVNVVTNLNAPPIVTSETHIHTVPVGFVMGITPYISDKQQIILNVRPTISRILRFVDDPNPELVDAEATNRIPEIQVREMESMLRLTSGQTAIIGGLMQDQLNKSTSGVPFLQRIPWLGELFKYRNDQIQKAELVIFLRAVTVNNPSLDEDLHHLKRFLPSAAR